MTESEKNALALSMTQTYFMIMPEEFLACNKKI